jgi:hypothetical protein
MTKPRRTRGWAVLIALASAGLLSGCYYYPYGYYPWGYPYQQPYAWGYPYSPGPPPPPSNQATPAPGAPQPLNPPIQQAPLPPPS